MKKLMSRMHAPVLALLALASVLRAQAPSTFEQRLQQVMSRPEYRHARFGVSVYSLDEHKPLYELNAQQLFVPGSVTKLFTMGTSLSLLGPDHRFRTPIYRTGPVNAAGTLEGDLILVASGDPNLSNRLQADGTLAFENVDHTYDGLPGAKAVPGDPLTVLRSLARQVAAHGIKKVAGHVGVDVSLFPEGTRELGTGVLISPIMVNDNVVDIFLEASAAEGNPVKLRLSPDTGYVRVVNQAKTAGASTRPALQMLGDTKAADGTHTVTIGGTLPAGKARLQVYRVQEPSVFAQCALVHALREAGVEAQPGPSDGKKSYTAQNQVAEHVSAPFSEEVKVTLKVSHNLHASMMPYLWGAITGKPGEQAIDAGFAAERAFLTKAGLDLTGAGQSDGAGRDAFFTPDFVVRYLDYIASQPYAAIFEKALPVLGVDGTLHDIQVGSPAAGKVHAKTGTYAGGNELRDLLMIHGKGFAGYTTAKDGRRLALALFVNTVAGDPATIAHTAGEALGEIAAAAWEVPPGR